MTLRIALRATCVLLAGLLAFSACTGSDEPVGPQVLERDGVTTLVLAEDPEGEVYGDDALVEGPLTLTENGCIAVTLDTGEQYVLTWPPGVELITGDATGVRVPDVGEIMVGQALSAGGGFYAPPRGDRMPDIPDRCLVTENDEVAIISDPSTIDF